MYYYSVTARNAESYHLTLENRNNYVKSNRIFTIFRENCHFCNRCRNMFRRNLTSGRLKKHFYKFCEIN